MDSFWSKRPQLNLKTSSDLQKAVTEYFDWAAKNNLIEQKAFSYQGDSWNHNIERPRVFNIKGLVVFLGIAERQWKELAKDPEFTDVCDWAEAVIYQQKFELAASNMLNANLIARDLGIAERSLLGSDPENPFPSVTTYQLPDNGRD